MKQILFATTNKNKVTRLKNFLTGVDIEIKLLSDLDYKIKEPKEVGTTPVEIAMNKAQYYWNNLKVKMPVISQDDTIELFNVPELFYSKSSIKKPVIEKFGEANDTNIINFYTELASKYSNKIDMRFNYGFGLCDNDNIYGKDAKIDGVLVNEVSKTIIPGYPTRAIVKVAVNNQYIFLSELSPNQQAIVDNDLAKAVKFLLSKLE